MPIDSTQVSLKMRRWWEFDRRTRWLGWRNRIEWWRRVGWRSRIGLISAALFSFSISSYVSIGTELWIARRSCRSVHCCGVPRGGFCWKRVHRSGNPRVQKQLLVKEESCTAATIESRLRKVKRLPKLSHLKRAWYSWRGLPLPTRKLESSEEIFKHAFCVPKPY